MNFFFFFNDTATTEIYTLSLHDALPIFALESALWCRYCAATTDEGAPIGLDDPNAARLTPAAQASKEDPTAFLALRDIFGDVADSSVFRDRFETALKRLWRDGTRATLQAYLDGRLA